MSRGERGTLIALAALALIAISFQTAVHYGWGRGPVVVVPAEAPAHPVVDLNQATWEELTLLPGIGETRARRIVAYRERVGEIRDPAEIREVSGIGEALFQQIRPRVTVRRLRSDRGR